MNEEKWFVFKCNNFQFWVFGKFCMKLWKTKSGYNVFVLILPTPTNRLNNVRNRKFWVSRSYFLGQGYITKFGLECKYTWFEMQGWYDITISCKTRNSCEFCESSIKAIVFNHVDIHSCFGISCSNLKKAFRFKLNW
jgi:hypothetical protein